MCVPGYRVAFCDIDKREGGHRMFDRTDHKAQPRCYLGPHTYLYWIARPTRKDGPSLAAALPRRPVMAWFR